MDEIKQCPYTYNGCISENKGKCLLGSPCDPCDEHGRRFRMVKVVTADGHEIWGRDFLPEPVIDAEQANEAILMVKRLHSRQART
jgi:hypothetical protein